MRGDYDHVECDEIPLPGAPRKGENVTLNRAVSPRGVQRAAFGIAGGALDAHHSTLVELRQAARAGVRARAAQTGDDPVDEVLDTWLLRVEVHPGRRDALLEQALASALERRLLLGAHPDGARRRHAERLLEQPPVGVAVHVAGRLMRAGEP